jgi:hypothetical protein
MAPWPPSCWRCAGAQTLLYEDVFGYARTQAIPVIACEYNIREHREGIRRASLESRAAHAIVAWMLLGASSAIAQEEGPAEQMQNSCQNALGYVGCDDLLHGKQGTSGPASVWGALAISRSSAMYGYSYSYPSAQEADTAAVNSCNAGMKGKADCTVRSTFSNNCIGLATSDDGAYGFSGNSQDLVATDREALSQCQKFGGKSCTTVLNYCTPGGSFHTWVGLAISMEPDPKVGISWGAVAQTTASKLALDSCVKDGGSRCKVRMLLHSQCVAFAKSPNGMWGAYNNIARQVAETNAIRKCQEANGTNCAVVLSKCSSDKTS